MNQYNFYSDFTQGDSALDGWTTTSGNVTTNSKGAVFTINKQGDAPTIQSEFAIFFGELEVKMQAAPGTGIVSSLVFESDDLDEIDWVCEIRGETYLACPANLPRTGSAWG